MANDFWGNPAFQDILGLGSRGRQARDKFGFGLNQGNFESAEGQGDLGSPVAIHRTDTEQTEVLIEYLTGDELGDRGIVFADFQFAGAEVPNTIDQSVIDIVSPIIPTWIGFQLKFNPPGGRYGLSLHEVRLVEGTEGT